MEKLYINAQGKINLSLDVINKRPDGYHNLKMVMQSVELHDVIEIKKVHSGINVMCNNSLVPGNNSNIAYKAAKALCEYTEKDLNVLVNIEKNIPVAAGMAGGSSDAAAVLKGMNELFDLNLGIDELLEIGGSIGADVPFCLCGGTMLAEGTGDILTPLKPFRDVNIVLAKPRVEVSTAWVFKNYNAAEVKSRPDTDSLIDSINKGELNETALRLGNVLETVTIKSYPVINDIKNELLEYGALGSLMSGSGPTVFGIFENVAKAEYAFSKISERGQLDCYLTKTKC